MSKRFVYLDFDDVLWATTPSVLSYANSKYDKNVTLQEIVECSYHGGISSLFPEVKSFESLMLEMGIYEKDRWLGSAEDFLRKYRDKCVVLTKTRDDEIAEMKQYAMDRSGFNDIPMIHVPYSQHKSIYKPERGLFIDDHAPNFPGFDDVCCVLYEPFGYSRAECSAHDGNCFMTSSDLSNLHYLVDLLEETL